MYSVYPNTALLRQADLWGLGSRMLEMRRRWIPLTILPKSLFSGYAPILTALTRQLASCYKLMAKYTNAIEIPIYILHITIVFCSPNA